MIKTDHLPLKKIFLSLLWTVLSIWLISGCMAQPGKDSIVGDRAPGPPSLVSADGANDFVTVDCLLPGQMRRLGTHVMFVTARRPTRSTAEDCAIRGGEYTISDRADYQTSLKLWLDGAQEGDAKSQYYVGTIYEKGPTGKPDYALAAVWYQKAAEQGYRQAAMNLGRLYETGSGVSQNAATASKWYAKASGMGEADLSMLINVEARSRIQELEKTLSAKELEIHQLHNHIKEITQELTDLRNRLHQRSSEAQTERQKLLSLQARYHGLQEQVGSKHAQHERAQQELQELKRRLAQESTTAQSSHKRIEELEQVLAKSHQDTTQIQLEKKRAQQELEEMKRRLAQKSTTAQSSHKQIEELEQVLAKSHQDTTQIQLEKKRAQRELEELQRRLAQESTTAQSNHKRIKELEQVLAKSQQDTTHRQMEKELEAIRVELESQQAVVSERDHEVKQLHQQIASLEEEAARQAQELEQAPAVDLGFDGPTIEIIDPPLALTRGIKVVAGPPRIPVPVGVSRQISGRVVAPAGLRILTMNGHVVQVDEFGVFTMDFPPLRGAQETFLVQILAVDIQNKRAAKKLMLVAGKTLVTDPKLFDEGMAVFGDYYALVIGNDRYQHWDPLHNAVSDAQAFADLLETRYGFKVTFLKDATRRDILKGLNNFRKSLKETDNLLVYYAGHGHLETDIDRGYWIPVDAEIDDTSQWILTPSITDLLELMSAKHVLIVADSCFAGKLTRSGLAKLRPGLSEEARMTMLKIVATKRVRTALTSGGNHPVLDMGKGGHSVFTGALLDVLGENQAILETERLFLAVRTRVINAAGQYAIEQIPTYWPIQFAGHESLGDFIFIPHQS